VALPRLRTRMEDVCLNPHQRSRLPGVLPSAPAPGPIAEITTAARMRSSARTDAGESFRLKAITAVFADPGGDRSAERLPLFPLDAA